MNQIRIDNEFKDLIPPLKDKERAALKDSIDREGCLDPVVVWKEEGILLDGHNRKEICEGLNIAFGVKQLSFPDRDAAKEWVLEHQLGRRNLDPVDLKLLWGRLYKLRQKQGARTDLTSRQNDEKSKTSEQIAEEVGVSPRSIERAGKFVEGFDKVKGLVDEGELEPEAVEKVKRMKAEDVETIADMPKKGVAQVLKGEPGAEDVLESAKAAKRRKPKLSPGEKVAAAFEKLNFEEQGIAIGGTDNQRGIDEIYNSK